MKEAFLPRLVLFGEPSRRRTLDEYLVHFHEERNHQGLAGRIPQAPPDALRRPRTVASEDVRGSEGC